MESMKGKVAVVTGASAGIGREAALAFGREGASVIVADVDVERGEKVAAEVAALGVDALFVRTDVAERRQVAELLRATVDRFGRLDYAFNNAGIEGDQALTGESSIDNWNRTIAMNLTGVYLCMREEIPRMLGAGAAPSSTTRRSPDSSGSRVSPPTRRRSTASSA